jgi:hypothetical protein
VPHLVSESLAATPAAAAGWTIPVEPLLAAFPHVDIWGTVLASVRQSRRLTPFRVFQRFHQDIIAALIAPCRRLAGGEAFYTHGGGAAAVTEWDQPIHGGRV